MMEEGKSKTSLEKEINNIKNIGSFLLWKNTIDKKKKLNWLVL